MSWNQRKTLEIALLTLCTCFGISAAPKPRTISIVQNNTVWYGNTSGLYRYQAENEQWTLVKGVQVSDMIIDDRILYIGTDQGIWYADSRYLDWKQYTALQGLSSDTVVRICADPDYIYEAGLHGISRLNKLTQEWESLSGWGNSRINDIYSDMEYLWVATDAGISVLDKKVESWKNYRMEQGLISESVLRIFFFTDNLWAVTERGFSLYNPGLKSWASIRLDPEVCGSRVLGLQVDEEYIWNISPEGVFRYSGKNRRWENFSRNTPLQKVNVLSVAGTGKNFWFASEQGIFSYQEEQRKWITYSAIEGLDDDSQEEIFIAGESVVSRHATTFNIYLPTEDLWKSFTPINRGSSASEGKRWERFSDERGTGLQSSSGQSLALQGYAYFRLKNKAEFPDPLFKSIGDYIMNKNLDSLVYDTLSSGSGEDSIVVKKIARFKDFLYWWPRAQINGYWSLGNDRSIGAMYDNTDPLGSVLGGAEYTGNQQDNIRIFNVRTKEQSDYFHSSLIKPMQYNGAKARLEFGPRQGEKKRRLLNTGVFAGRSKNSFARKLIPFQEDNFYYLKVSNIITGSVQIWVDGRLMDPRDYSVERTRGILTFKNDVALTPDSRIEVALEYEPQSGSTESHPSDLVTAEEVLVVGDHSSIGVTGLYRGFREPDRIGTGFDTNRLMTGALNGLYEVKSNDNQVYFRVVPEIALSYNDSIVVDKEGSAGVANLDARLWKARVTGMAQINSSQYESPGATNSIYGRLYYSGAGEVAYDLTQNIPLAMGINVLNGSRGTEQREWGQFLVAATKWPSFKVGAIRYTGSQFKLNTTQISPKDSIINNRIGAWTEMAWNCPGDILDKFKIADLSVNGLYGVNMVGESLRVRQPGDTANLLSDSTQARHMINQNLFGLVRISPIRSVILEVRQVFRLFQQVSEHNLPILDRASRYRPEYVLYLQEPVPGVIAYGNLQMERGVYPQNQNQTAFMDKNRINTSLTLLPGIWWKLLNPLQLNAGYMQAMEDSTSKPAYVNFLTMPTSILSTLSRSYSFNPILDFNLVARAQNKTEISRQMTDGDLSAEELRIYNTVEGYMNDRKTKGVVEQVYDRQRQYSYSILQGDTVFEKQVIEARAKWIQRWSPSLRSELPCMLTWRKTDTTAKGYTSRTKGVVQSASNNTSQFVNGVSVAGLVDFRTQPKFIKELRVQYQTGIGLSDGTFFSIGSYDKSWDHQLDISLKASRNLTARMLLICQYIYTKRLLKYDLAELKVTAIF